MPTNSKIDWTKRITAADRYFKKWYDTFEVEKGIKYFEGFQWDKLGAGFPAEYTPYTVNLINSTIRIKRASLLFDNPNFIIKPEAESDAPGFDPIASAQRANLKTIAVNSYVRNRNNYFLKETKMALEDSFYGFGLIEVGYSANIIANPNLQKPLYDESSTDETPEIEVEPEEVVDSEKVFVKRIHFSQFRVGGRDGYILERSNWCGYFDYYDFNDAKIAWLGLIQIRTVLQATGLLMKMLL
jgi:hypothetical protein